MTIAKTTKRRGNMREQTTLTCLLLVDMEKKQKDHIVEALVARGYAVSYFDRRLPRFQERRIRTYPVSNTNETIIVCPCQMDTLMADGISVFIYWPKARCLYSIPYLDDQLFQQIIQRNMDGIIAGNRPVPEWLEQFEEAKNYRMYLDPIFQTKIIQSYRQLPDIEEEENNEEKSEEQSLRLIRERAQDLLSKAECDVLEQILLGKNNRKIAEACFLSVATVNNHVHRITKKMGANDRTHTIKRAIEYGWVTF